MGRNGYTAYTDATVQRYNRDLSVAQGQVNKLYDDYRELESLYNGLDEDIMQWDTEQDHVEQATDQQGVWKGERRNKYDEYLWDTMGIVFQQYTSTYEQMKEQIFVKMNEISQSISSYESEIQKMRFMKDQYQRKEYNKKQQWKAASAVNDLSARGRSTHGK